MLFRCSRYIFQNTNTAIPSNRYTRIRSTHGYGAVLSVLRKIKTTTKTQQQQHIGIILQSCAVIIINVIRFGGGWVHGGGEIARTRVVRKKKKKDTRNGWTSCVHKRGDQEGITRSVHIVSAVALRYTRGGDDGTLHISAFHRTRCNCSRKCVPLRRIFKSKNDRGIGIQRPVWFSITRDGGCAHCTV
jgi:hypothetical protein